MSADLIGEIDRAVLELPEDLQIIWMRFRSIVHTERYWPTWKPIVRLYQYGGNAMGADIYWTEYDYTYFDGTPFEVARTITVFFRDRTTV